MDDVKRRADAAHDALEKFNESLRKAMGELERAHGHVAPLWDDSMRRDYDRQWKPAEEKMQEYNTRVGPNYVRFLSERLKHLQRYLHGT